MFLKQYFQTHFYEENHKSFFLLKNGSIILKKVNLNEKEINVDISSGECYVKNNIVTIIL